jgi:hypothetical protein
VRRDQREGRRQHLIQVHIANLCQPLTPGKVAKRGPLSDVDNTPAESRMTIEGTCAFNVATREISDFNPRSIEIVERSPDGTLRSSSTRTLPTGEGVQRLVIFGPAIVSTDAGTELRIES